MFSITELNWVARSLMEYLIIQKGPRFDCARAGLYRFSALLSHGAAVMFRNRRRHGRLFVGSIMGVGGGEVKEIKGYCGFLRTTEWSSPQQQLRYRIKRFHNEGRWRRAPIENQTEQPQNKKLHLEKKNQRIKKKRLIKYRPWHDHRFPIQLRGLRKHCRELSMKISSKSKESNHQ